MEKFDFYIPTRVLFGPGKLDELAVAKLPGQKALIVTTAGKSVKKYGYLDRVVELLKKNHGTQSVVFDKVLPNPLLSHVREAAALCRAEGCDFVVGLGGGSRSIRLKPSHWLRPTKVITGIMSKEAKTGGGAACHRDYDDGGYRNRS